MDSPPVSVVVVSRERPDALMRCLNGLAQLDYPLFEIVCVACPAGIAALSARPDAERIKTVVFDRPNISEARNLGITEAAGEIVAFIDDDAVPEPLWLWHLTAPFSEPNVAAKVDMLLAAMGFPFNGKPAPSTAPARRQSWTSKATSPAFCIPNPTGPSRPKAPTWRCGATFWPRWAALIRLFDSTLMKQT